APGTHLVEAIHDDNFSPKKGYDRNFLSTTVELPALSAEMLGSVAVNHQPGTNGMNYLDYTNFSILFNREMKLPFLTAVNIAGEEDELALAHEPRTSDIWFQDERIKVQKDFFQFSNSDYAGSGFQKGHMVRYYDPAWGATEEIRKIAMGDTFHYTNCCPQLANFNAGVWNDLEDYYMSRAIFQDKKVTVFTGPIFNKAKRINKLLVPVNYWKVIVYNENEQLKALGFIISHEVAFEKLVEEKLLVDQRLVQPKLKKADIDRLFIVRNLKKWVVKIKLIEEKTGIRFNLNKRDVNKLRPKYFNKTPFDFNKSVAKVKGFATNNIGSAITNDTEMIMNL
ncbi:MAG: DNA/RNA non-specific endonuclease, partial [Segetibacter sp.]